MKDQHLLGSGSQSPAVQALMEQLKKNMQKDKGMFQGKLQWSLKINIIWRESAISISNNGQLLCLTNSTLNTIQTNNSKHKKTSSSTSKESQNTNIPSSRILIKHLHSCEVQFDNTLPISNVILVTSVNNESYFFKLDHKDTFIRFLSSLMIWQNMNIYGIHNKYFNVPVPLVNVKPQKYMQVSDEDDNTFLIKNEEKNLLVCRFKVFGPVSKMFKKIVEHDNQKNNIFKCNDKQGWFYTIGVLKSNGILDLLHETNGSLLYSVNVASLIRSEIRHLHHSIFENSNILYIGIIDKLRDSIYTSRAYINNYSKRFFITSSKGLDLKHYDENRILIQFDLHIDFEDWYVALQSLAAREYVGINCQYSDKSSLRISKKLHVDILEANFSYQINENSSESSNFYCEIDLWNQTWARSSIVDSIQTPFWREEFLFELPILTDSFKILVKKCTKKKQVNKKKSMINLNSTSSHNFHQHQTLLQHQVSQAHNNSNSNSGDIDYSEADYILGVVDIDEEIIENSSNKEIWVPIYSDLVKSEPVGQICLRLQLKEWHVLPPNNFEVLEKMLMDVSLKDLITFLSSSSKISSIEDLEEISGMMLDIFQAMHQEEIWFNELIKFELSKIEKNHSHSSANPSTNFFNTLFRGNSILSKTFEKYNLRVGQEFLEKIVGEFVLKVADDNLDCEIDPARIKVNPNNNETKEQIIDENFIRLYDYIEIIWNKIYNSCNDLPAPIRCELELLRNKLDQSLSSNTLALNCITGFLFLRFICPAILNPKLFFLIKDHQTGKIKRTLTLISKILLTLSNRTRFGAKEPWLIKMNFFLEQHEDELLDYLDIITNRKFDNRPKLLDLSDTVVRPDISISSQISAELPTNPFLIDRYLRLTELANLLASDLVQKEQDITVLKGVNKRNSFMNSYRPSSVIFEENVIQKNSNLAFATEDMFNKMVKLNRKSVNCVTIDEFKQELYYILKKLQSVDTLLTSFENPSIIFNTWNNFINVLTEAAVLNGSKKLLYLKRNIVYTNNNITHSNSYFFLNRLTSNHNNNGTTDDADNANAVKLDSNYKKLSENGFESLKLKFFDDNVLVPLTPITRKNSVGGGSQKLSRLIRSASNNGFLKSPTHANFHNQLHGDSQKNGSLKITGNSVSVLNLAQISDDAQRSPFKKGFWKKKF